MFHLNKGVSLYKRFRDDLKGNVGPMFAVCSVLILGTMGAAMDYSTLSNAENRSQAIADATALTAAIFVKNNGRIPRAPDVDEEGNPGPEEGFQHGKPYKASEIGYNYKSWVEGDVTVTVYYDDNSKEATVTVTGKTRPAFIHVFDSHRGKGGSHARGTSAQQEERNVVRDRTMTFTATSVVSYYEIEDAFPASIALVLDNSGSMRWDDARMIQTGQDGNDETLKRPDNPTARIDALKKSVATFREDLKRRLGSQTTEEGQRILRTGILPYNSEIVAQSNGVDRKMSWGYEGISKAKIDPMKPEGGTNSNPPMKKADEWLDDEDAEHRTEADDNNVAYRDPLKFVIFMTDGQNTSGNRKFEEKAGTNDWYKKWYADGNWYHYSRWNYPSGTNDQYKRNRGFKEGELILLTDSETLATCKDMHNDTIIFTIAYGLEEGRYYEPFVDNPPEGDNRTYYHGAVTAETQASATSLLRQCASEPANFIEASDGKELEAAFDQIQNAIVKELIRIKS